MHKYHTEKTYKTKLIVKIHLPDNVDIKFRKIRVASLFSFQPFKVYLKKNLPIHTHKVIFLQLNNLISFTITFLLSCSSNVTYFTLISFCSDFLLDYHCLNTLQISDVIVFFSTGFSDFHFTSPLRLTSHVKCFITGNVGQWYYFTSW